MIFVTGDTHADFTKFSVHRFPEQKNLTKDDFVIICGDFGLWHDSKVERYWLDWLNDKPFTTLFVDGNHENFDRLYSDEFDEVDFHGGKAHQIRDSIFHLMRGYIFNLNGKKFFAFGGASSHDIADGILDRSNFSDESEFKRAIRHSSLLGKQFRVNHISWWKEELPSEEEMQRGKDELKKHGNKVDYVITHCLPQPIVDDISGGMYEPDQLTLYFKELLDEGLKFTDWYCGHYHIDRRYSWRFSMLYEGIEPIFA